MVSDNDISASTRSKKPRPGFDRLLSLIEAGQIKDVYAYSASRLTRRPAEFETLIQLAEQKGVTFHVVTGHIDLSIEDPVVYAAVAREVFLRGEERVEVPDPNLFNAEADAIRADIADVQAAVKAKTITMATALPLLSDAEDRLRAVEREQRQAAVQAVSPNWAYESAVEMLAMPLGQMRALLSRHLTAVEIEAAPTPGRNSMDLSRVVLHWVDGTTERLTNGVPVVRDAVSVVQA